MLQLTVKPGDRLVKGYYDVLGQLGQLHIDHEMAVRSAFQGVLSGYSNKLKWTLVPEYSIPKSKGHRVVVDGAVLDFWKQRRGFWEAKDEYDDLDREIKSKIAKGYPTSNIIFQAPDRAVLYQHNMRQGLNEDIRDPKNLSALLNEFFAYREPDIEEWEAAVAEFSQRLPEIADRARQLIDVERKNNSKFIERFEEFYALCRQAINPNLSADAVEGMLIQHLLTERIFRRVFQNEEFRTQNVIAAEIEKVISALVMPHGSRDRFLQDLNRFYKAVERSAEDKAEYSEKQDFLNTVYERFFQGYSPKEADTHGVVYTPQPIVDFMVRSVEDILKKEFGKSLSDKGVHVLDPFVGTGNFITRVMKEIKKTSLKYKYEHELHCNEVMLMPYYIAGMNIANQYYEQTGEFKEFPGICLVDTFELAEAEQGGFEFMTEENTARVKQQKKAPIFVAIGNPPYNAGQEDENDNNRNRSYPALDARVSSTYGKASNASSFNKSRDPFIRAFRWASDRIGNEGVVALITNSSYIDQHAANGIREHLTREFNAIYLLDLGGNVRKNPSISGTTHNVFGIKLGVAIAFLVRSKVSGEAARVHYFAVDDSLRRENRLKVLEDFESLLGVGWQPLELNTLGAWVREGEDDDFKTFLPIGSKETKAGKVSAAIFEVYSLGANTNRDAWVYAFEEKELRQKIAFLASNYNDEVHRWIGAGKPPNVDVFLATQAKELPWSSRLKENLKASKLANIEDQNFRKAVYRPFSARLLYFDDVLIHRRGKWPIIKPDDFHSNLSICATGIGAERPFAATATDVLPDLNFYGPGTVPQWFPFYVFDESGFNRRENITEWALNEFRTHYEDKNITKWSIFHYVYALLHHPEYRKRYAANLKRELPRIPYAPEFHAFARAGERLTDLHVNYEKQPEYPLERIESPNEKLNWRVEKMRLGRDRASLIYNSFLTLRGIPPETYEYRLGNRSALEWVIDQYQVSTDIRSGITNDPNRADDPEYIVRLIGQVINVSLETIKIVKDLPVLIASEKVGAGA